MSNKTPTAKIAVNKNVVPAGTNVYLNSGQEFEIELFNPTKENVLAKIFINGESISSTGIIIRPGRREWIERFIDKPRKFKFDVYEVDSKDSDVKEAIKDNGSIRVEFYKEKSKANPQLLLGNWNGFNQPYNPNPWTVQPQPYYPNNPFYYGTINCSIDGNNGNVTLSDSNSTFNLSNSGNTSCGAFYCSTTDNYGAVNLTSSISTNSLNINSVNQILNEKKDETGRIEEGSASSQQFIEVDMDFEMFILNKVEYKLLPKSKEPVDLSKIKVYCVECGAARKKSVHKFCPHCGTKFE